MYTVYIVDDDNVILDEIVSTIPWLDNGFKVAGYTTSSAEAILQIEKRCPDVVFTDLNMPGINGRDMIKSLCEKNIICEYVMLSAYDSYENSSGSFCRNEYDSILKPINLEEVQIILERLGEKLSKIRPSPRDPEDKSSPVFTEIIAYLKENYNQRHTLDTLAKHFSLNAEDICNLFG